MTAGPDRFGLLAKVSSAVGSPRARVCVWAEEGGVDVVRSTTEKRSYSRFRRLPDNVVRGNCYVRILTISRETAAAAGKNGTVGADDRV